MTPEERLDRVERELEFLASQQAQSFARIERDQQEIERHSEQIAQLGGFLSGTARLIEDQVRQSHESFRELRQTQKNSQKDFDNRLRRLALTQGQTGEHLNALIGVVESCFSNDRSH